MSYLIYVAMFGAAVVIFLWLRDARIFFRTGLPGYRKAAYWGVLYGALATFGMICTIVFAAFTEMIGIGLVIASLYLQARHEREHVWKNESTLERFLGSVPRPKANKK
ncbi:MAG: ABC transporter permease [Methanoregula sp.]|nr:ABC transporter permease [Methanoregula sp.]